jgi:hypothetical protein
MHSLDVQNFGNHGLNFADFLLVGQWDEICIERFTALSPEDRWRGHRKN